MPTGRRIAIKGFRVESGKVVRDRRHLDVAERLRQRASKRLRVVKPCPASRPVQKGSVSWRRRSIRTGSHDHGLSPHALEPLSSGRHQC